MIEKVATQIWDLLDGGISIFEGTYRNYRLAKDKAVRGKRTPMQRKTRHQTRRTEPDVEENLDEIESAIETLEAEISDLGRRLGSAVETQNDSNIREWKELFLQKQEELEVRLRAWEQVSASS